MTDVVIIGGGVIGLSIAREISRSGREIIILEKNLYLLYNNDTGDRTPNSVVFILADLL